MLQLCMFTDAQNKLVLDALDANTMESVHKKYTGVLVPKPKTQKSLANKKEPKLLRKAQEEALRQRREKRIQNASLRAMGIFPSVPKYKQGLSQKERDDLFFSTWEEDSMFLRWG